MPLEVGTRLGPYEIQAAIGAGGMGEVYRARDTKLGRDVAIKVLPDAFVHDADRVARFQREARALAALNHPNIGGIHGLEDAHGATALVLELIEGPTLHERIAGGPIPLDEALPIARQIAEALAAAHEQGVIHRDLKPSNIKVTPDGVVKVLDFGLAKLTQASGAGAQAPDMTASPTITSPAMMTGIGTLLGTAAYMAPEQAKGRPADKRSDIWAFGCVLYEMLTGKRAFDGEDVSETLAAVLRGQPEWSALPEETPPAIRTLLQRCLERNRRERIADIAAALFVLREQATFGITSGSRDRASVPTRRRIALAATATLVLGAGAAAIAVWVATRSAPPPVTRFVIPTAGPSALSIQGVDRDLAITPDGTRLVYRGTNRLLVRALDQIEPTVIGGVGSPRGIFVSPDGQWVGFFDGIIGLKKVAITGGPAITLTAIDGISSRGGTWGEDGTIVYATNFATTGLQRVSSAGGEPIALTKPNRERGEGDHYWPEFLPGGRAVLFTIIASDSGLDNAQVAVLDLSTGTYRTVLRGGHHAHYLPSGHILYGASGGLRTVPFDLRRLEVAGPPIPVLDAVVTTASGGVDVAVAKNGTLVYVPGGLAAGVAARPIYWTDATGNTTPLRATPAGWSQPAFPPDGRQLAIEIISSQDDVWIHDWTRDTLSRLTLDRAPDRTPVWTPDGQRIVFSSTRSGSGWTIHWQRVDGGGGVQLLSEGKVGQWPTSWHPSGRFLAFVEQTRQGNDVMILPMEGDEASGWKPGKPTAFVNTPYLEEAAMFSPDGQWIAYHSNETGQNEVYVRPFPGPGGRAQISSSGGVHPLWSRTRQELFFGTPDQRIMVASYVTGPGTFRPEKPRLWTETRFTTLRGIYRSFDLHPDGQRLALAPLVETEARDAQDTVPPHFVVVQNWLEELKRLVPTD